MAIRLFFFLLVLANLAFFAWTQGYLGATDDGHEPQRLAQQLHADKLRIVRDAQAPLVKEPALACRLIDGLNAAEAETLKAALAGVGVTARILPPAEPKHFRVIIGDLANKAVADRKAAELTRLGFEGHSPAALESGRYEIVLGSFPTEAAAREFLQGLAPRGIRLARLDAGERLAPSTRVEARGPASTLLGQLPQLIAPHADATVVECAP